MHTFLRRRESLPIDSIDQRLKAELKRLEHSLQLGYLVVCLSYDTISQRAGTDQASHAEPSPQIAPCTQSRKPGLAIDSSVGDAALQSYPSDQYAPLSIVQFHGMTYLDDQIQAAPVERVLKRRHHIIDAFGPKGIHTLQDFQIQATVFERSEVAEPI
ncbi:MAG: hypothetical protein Q9185_006773 [Variospora sp. 1 TL-2023]